MLLGADTIASTPLAALLAASAASPSTALSPLDPRVIARRHRNVQVRWGFEPAPVDDSLEREETAPAPAEQSKAEVPGPFLEGIGGPDRSELPVRAEKSDWQAVDVPHETVPARAIDAAALMAELSDAVGERERRARLRREQRLERRATLRRAREEHEAKLAQWSAEAVDQWQANLAAAQQDFAARVAAFAGPAAAVVAQPLAAALARALEHRLARLESQHAQIQAAVGALGSDIERRLDAGSVQIGAMRAQLLRAVNNVAAIQMAISQLSEDGLLASDAD